jgi:HTH-type transcriptional regulator / antitoxin HipB
LICARSFIFGADDRKLAVVCTIVHIAAQAVATARAVGLTVKERRAELGLDQSELSLVAGVSRRTVHAIEHGKPTIQLAALVAVLQAVGLDLAALPRGVDRERRIVP